DNTVTLLNKVVRVTGQTSFPTAGGKIESLKARDIARIALRDTANGPTAVEVFQFASSPPTGFSVRIVLGAVASIHGYLLDLPGGYQLDISRAKIESAGEHRSLTIDSITVGTPIKAWVALAPMPSDPLQCSEIHVQPRDEGQVGGVLQAVDLSTGAITVLNKTIQITPRTSFPASGADSIERLRPGCYVHVSFRADDKAPVALQVLQTDRLELHTETMPQSHGVDRKKNSQTSSGSTSTAEAEPV
ncbi:MAG: DUF5666 domain-containing protein, partial [Blastocatellia bacterium]